MYLRASGHASIAKNTTISRSCISKNVPISFKIERIVGNVQSAFDQTTIKTRLTFVIFLSDMIFSPVRFILARFVGVSQLRPSQRETFLIFESLHITRYIGPKQK